MSRTVGMIGLGIMGSAMAANLAHAGFEVIGFDILPDARRALARVGGTVAHSDADVVERAPIVISSLPSAAALETVIAEIECVRAPHSIVIETSTLPLEVKEAARARLQRTGMTMLDCPLSGTGGQARTKDLVVYASGARPAYVACIAVFDGFARAHHYLGPFGAGSKMKYVANHLVAIHNVAAAEAIVLAIKAGLDPAVVLRVGRDGACVSRMYEVLEPMMVPYDYSHATMKVEAWQKEMPITGDSATRLDCPTTLFAAAASIYTAARASGRAKEDTAAVCAVLADM